MEYLYIYFFIINAISLSFMKVDKLRAIKKKWRIRESTLFALAILGGAFGSILGMLLFRHKTRKAAFYLVFGGSLLLHLLIFNFLKY